MTRDYIIYRIRNREEKISSKRATIKKKKKDRSELKDLKKKVESYQKEFKKIEKDRRKKLGSIDVRGLGLNIVNIYIKGVKGFIVGSKYKKAYNGLTEASNRIQKKIKAIDGEIQIYEKEIIGLEKEISSLKKQLKDIEDNENGQ